MRLVSEGCFAVEKHGLIEIIDNNIEKYRIIPYIYDAINHHEHEPYPTALRRNSFLRTHFWSVFTDSFRACH